MHVSLSVLVSQEVLQMIPKFCFPFDVERYNSSLLACGFFFSLFFSTCTSLSPPSRALTWLLFHLHKQLQLKKKNGNEIRRVFVHCSGKIRHNHTLPEWSGSFSSPTGGITQACSALIHHNLNVSLCATLDRISQILKMVRLILLMMMSSVTRSHDAA